MNQRKKTTKTPPKASNFNEELALNFLGSLTDVLQEQTLTTEQKVVEVCSLIQEWQKSIDHDDSVFVEAEFAWLCEQVEGLNFDINSLEEEKKTLEKQNEFIGDNGASVTRIRNDARLREIDLEKKSLMTRHTYYNDKLMGQKCK